MDRSELTKAQRWKVADYLAIERLPEVNKLCAPVTVKNTIYTRHIKRLIDIVVSFLVLVVTVPINLVIGMVTLFDVGRPIFFRQTRVGKNGKFFKIIKFRNMRNVCDERGELLPPEQRVTKWGRFVRKTSLDELLNFWSILKGDMSLIGPRPLPPEYVHRYSVRHRARLSVRPGLECPPHAMLNHVWSWQEQFENDVWYVENMSFCVDCMMCVRLVQFALDRKSNSARANVNVRGSFMGYDERGRVITMGAVPEEYIERAFKEVPEGAEPVLMKTVV